VTDSSRIVRGAVIEWDSPLFGLLSAVALSVTERTVMGFHPLTEQEASIPLAWVRASEQVRQAAQPTAAFFSGGKARE
jgi:hypothetical protein